VREGDQEVRYGLSRVCVQRDAHVSCIGVVGSFNEQDVRLANQVFSLAAERFVDEPLFAYRTHYDAQRQAQLAADAAPTSAAAAGAAVTVVGSTSLRYAHSSSAEVRERARIDRSASPLDLYLQFVRLVARVSRLIAFEELIGTDDEYIAQLQPIYE
jgi:hypothetical protein